MIKIYGKTNCVWCARAKSLANMYSLEYIYYDIDMKEHYADLKEQLADIKTVPQIFWNNRYIGGYKEFSQEIENTLGGYGEQLF